MPYTQLEEKNDSGGGHASQLKRAAKYDFYIENNLRKNSPERFGEPRSPENFANSQTTSASENFPQLCTTPPQKLATSSV